ncbi:helix-turn-helix domain-containing protein [Dongia rigui]|uniref:Helix-turn-helix domain-containing protein n=1 Tax=Dongia rigui TaxID=940149 RepID=A0ABU5E1X0_9PROT|nr:helix-turn-helix domain-containing protein [Dongia rigui]MDY0873200.1 helix-turn-helix domain-containing protein [Dongia rigui]
MPHSSVSPLLDLSLFDGLSADARTKLQAHCFVQTEPADAVLFEQGQMAQFLHVILQGRVALVGEAPATDGRSAPDDGAIIEMFGPGEALILAAVLLNMPYMMSAHVMAVSRIAFVPATLVRELLDQEAAFAKATSLMLARHWRLLSRQLKDQKLRSGGQRLARYLLSLTQGIHTGPATFDLPIDRRSLASWLGMTAENLSRSLTQLKPLGVEVSGRHAQVADVATLRAFSAEDDLR